MPHNLDILAELGLILAGRAICVINPHEPPPKLAAGIQNRPAPTRLPINIYGTEGDWETSSTPSRDARLKTAFKEVRDTAERFLPLWRARDAQLVYNGFDLATDLLTTHERAAAQCVVSYRRSDGSEIRFGYEEARRRLFAMSFDPHHCVERR